MRLTRRSLFLLISSTIVAAAKQGSANKSFLINPIANRTDSDELKMAIHSIDGKSKVLSFAVPIPIPHKFENNPTKSAQGVVINYKGYIGAYCDLKDPLKIKRFDVSQGNKFSGHCAFTQDGNYFLTPEFNIKSKEGVIKERRSDNLKVTRVISVKGKTPHYIEIFKNFAYICFSGKNGKDSKVVKYSYPEFEEIKTWKAPENGVRLTHLKLEAEDRGFITSVRVQNGKMIPSELFQLRPDQKYVTSLNTKESHMLFNANVFHDRENNLLFSTYIRGKSLDVFNAKTMEKVFHYKTSPDSTRGIVKDPNSGEIYIALDSCKFLRINPKDLKKDESIKKVKLGICNPNLLFATHLSYGSF